MKGKTAFPFLTLPDDAIRFGGWTIGDPDQPLVTAHDVLEGWDYERDLEVAVAFRVDFDAASRALGMDADDLALAVVLKGGTGAGSMPRRVDLLDRTAISAASPAAGLAAGIPSAQLSGRLRLELSVVLERAPTAPGVLSPRWPGARLWRTEKDILLEDGGDSRFPIEMASFSRAFTDGGYSRASWYLDWTSQNFHADFGGSVRIYVNSDLPEIQERFVAGDGPTLQAILGDVMSQMIGVALDYEDCDDLLAECEDNTVGRQIRNWMDLSFPGRTVGSVRNLRDSAPGRFRAAILSAAEVEDVQ
ncbi:hypothetical protein [Oricola sp.]|uniref:hypothetical protein n=1 Tax=Oricola sp. TaxID=1979950 RepID=UPI003511E835